MPDAFISYSADAKKWAGKLASSLRREGVVTWSDFENLNPGERRFEQLQQALDQARYYIVVLGPRNVMRDWQDREWQGALERTWSDPDRRIIPVLIGHAVPPAFLRNWVSIRLEPGRNELPVVKRLAEIIKKPGAREELQRDGDRLGGGWRKRIRDIESTAKRLKV
jgi:TIR domain-containing protein